MQKSVKMRSKVDQWHCQVMVNCNGNVLARLPVHLLALPLALGLVTAGVLVGGGVVALSAGCVDALPRVLALLGHIAALLLMNFIFIFCLKSIPISLLYLQQMRRSLPSPSLSSWRPASGSEAGLAMLLNSFVIDSSE